MTKPSKAIPEFANGAQERAYWESHDSTEHLDGSQQPCWVAGATQPTQLPQPFSQLAV